MESALVRILCLYAKRFPEADTKKDIFLGQRLCDVNFQVICKSLTLFCFCSFATLIYGASSKHKYQGAHEGRHMWLRSAPNSGRGISSECEGQTCYPPRKQFLFPQSLFQFCDTCKNRPKRRKYKKVTTQSSTKLWIKSQAHTNKSAKEIGGAGMKQKSMLFYRKSQKVNFTCPKSRTKIIPKKFLRSKTWKRSTQWQGRREKGGSRGGGLLGMSERERRRWSQKEKCQSSSFAVSEVL